MRFRIRPLEERIAYDAAFAADVADRGGTDFGLGDTLSTLPDAEASPQSPGNAHDTNASPDRAADADNSTVEALLSDQGAGLRLLVVSSQVKDAALLGEAALDGVEVVYYDAEDTSLDSLLQAITQTLDGRQADSIGFVNHGLEGAFQLTESIGVSESSLAENAALGAFWNSIGDTIADGGRVDLLACDLAGNDAGLRVLAMLDALIDCDSCNRSVAASTDTTANEAQGGDWTLEYGNIDAAATYFSSAELSAWEGKLLTLNVSDITDEIDPLAQPTDTDLTLREAINLANAVAGADEIVVQAGTYTLTLDNLGVDDDIGEVGDLDVQSEIVIRAANPGDTVIIKGDDGSVPLDFSHRIFDVLNGGALTLQNIIVGGGETTVDGAGAYVDGDSSLTLESTMFRGLTTTTGNGGGIYTEGTVIIDASTITENIAVDGGGGGIYRAAGDVTIRNGSVISNNQALDGIGGGDDGRGGGIHTGPSDRGSTAGTVLITDSTVSNNFAASLGGGIYRSIVMFEASARVAIQDSEFFGNEASKGGAIYNDPVDDFATKGDVNIRGSLFWDNEARVDGEGNAIYTSGVLNIENSTFLDNVDPSINEGSTGAQIFIVDAPPDCRDPIERTQVTHSTFQLSTQDAGFNHVHVFYDHTAISPDATSFARVVFSHTIFDNRATSLLDGSARPTLKAESTTVTGLLFGLGYNLFSDAPDSQVYTQSGSGDLFDTNPKLLGLANNGGGTRTLALDTTAGNVSPAIDVGALTPDPIITGFGPLEFDQRAEAPYARIFNTNADIGAFEVVASTISGLVFIDGDGDGLHPDAGGVFFGVDVTLTNTVGGASVTVQTNITGNYTFTETQIADIGLDPGEEFYIEVDLNDVGGRVPTLKDVSANTSDANDSDIARIGELNPGRTDNVEWNAEPLVFDAGFHFVTTVSGIVYIDTGSTFGDLDSGDARLANASVELLESRTIPNTLMTIADGNGFYQFDNVFVPEPTGNSPESVRTVTGPIPPGLFENGDGSLTVGIADTALAAGPVTDLDVGLASENLLAGRVIYDVDGDGLENGTDSGINGVQVDGTWAGPDGVFDTPDDVFLGSKITAFDVTFGDGFYEFRNHPNGAIRVDVVGATLPSNIIEPTADPDGIGFGSINTAQSVSEAEVFGFDFLYTEFVQQGFRFSGTIWKDVYMTDNIVQGTETLLEGVTITLLGTGNDLLFGTADDVMFTEVSDVNGDYTFLNVPFGQYVLSYVPAGTAAGTTLSPIANINNIFPNSGVATTTFFMGFEDQFQPDIVDLPVICPEEEFVFTHEPWELLPWEPERQIFPKINLDNPDTYVDWDYLDQDTPYDRVADFFAEEAQSLREYLDVTEDLTKSPIRDEATRAQYDFRSLNDFFDFLERRGFNFRGLNSFKRWRVDVPDNI